MPWVTKRTVFFRLPDADEVAAHLQPGDEVERAEWLVHVDDFGAGGEGSGDLDSLAHAAGKLARVTVLKAGEADHIDVVGDGFLALLLKAPVVLRNERT